MENIKFSVLIPAYNAEKYISECVNSVLNQGYENLEIIIADDCSSDNTAAVCKSFSDSRIKVVRCEKNRGPLMTRLFAVSQASGDYCLFIDCDDYVDNGYLNRLADVINEENCDMVVCSFRRVCGDEIFEAATPWQSKTVFDGEAINDFRKEFLFSNFLNSMCTKTVKTSLLKSDKTDYTPFESFKNGEDLIESLPLVFGAEKIVYLPECWYNYRVNDTSITHTVNPESYKSILSARKYAYEFLEKSSFFDEEIKKQYCGLVIKIIIGFVKLIASSNLDMIEKEKTFDAISVDEFYLFALENGNLNCLSKKEKILFGLFRQEQYRFIVLILRGMSK